MATKPSYEPLCLWRHEVMDKLWTGSLRASNDGVVVAHRSGGVCLRDHDTGEPIWCESVDGASDVEPVVFATDNRVLVMTPQGVTSFRLSDGAVRWIRAGDYRSAVIDGRGR